MILGRALLELRVFIDRIRVSSVYRSTPQYVVNQPDFYNLVLQGETSLKPLGLLERTQAVEAHFGRDRSHELIKGPRTLDIDILYLGCEVFQHPSLTIPHPGIRERAFVLVPLLELDPDMVDPVDGASLAGYMREVAGQGIYLHAPPPL